jgi:hypothetical protein
MAAVVYGLSLRNRRTRRATSMRSPPRPLKVGLRNSHSRGFSSSRACSSTVGIETAVPSMPAAKRTARSNDGPPPFRASSKELEIASCLYTDSASDTRSADRARATSRLTSAFLLASFWNFSKGVRAPRVGSSGPTLDVRSSRYGGADADKTTSAGNARHHREPSPARCAPGSSLRLDCFLPLAACSGWNSSWLAPPNQHGSQCVSMSAARYGPGALDAGGIGRQRLRLTGVAPCHLYARTGERAAWVGSFG